jgi:hypothetical protein
LGESIDTRAVKALVERIIAIESNGDSNAKNNGRARPEPVNFLTTGVKLFEDTDVI